VGLEKIMIDKDRTAEITIGVEKYELILTMKAVKEIARRYGSLEAVGERMTNPKDLAETFTEPVWLTVLLANQAILIHNYKNPNNGKDRKELLTEKAVELLTTPKDILKINSAIAKTLTLGTKRNIVRETPKNAKSE
jgi:hypothetical protein